MVSRAAEQGSAKTLKCVSRLLLEIAIGREGSPRARLEQLVAQVLDLARAAICQSQGRRAKSPAAGEGRAGSGGGWW